jgi:AcrR family transcriptional regulator
MSSSPKVQLNPRKQARQSRAGVTVEAIVEAAARILSTDGAPALTTNRIAEVAGVSVGSVYQYFPNKEAIVVALIGAQLNRDEDLVLELTQRDHSDLRAAISATAAALCQHQHRLAPLLQQVLPLLSPLRQETLVRERVLRLSQHFDAVLVQYLDELRPELRDPERRRLALGVMTDALRGVLNAATLGDPEQLLSDAFHADVSRLALGLLK